MNWLRKLRVGVAKYIFVIANFALGTFIIAIPFHFLWNLLMSEIIGLKTITLWKAWELLVLIALLQFLFKSSSSSKSSSD